MTFHSDVRHLFPWRDAPLQDWGLGYWLTIWAAAALAVLTLGALVSE